MPSSHHHYHALKYLDSLPFPWHPETNKNWKTINDATYWTNLCINLHTVLANFGKTVTVTCACIYLALVVVITTSNQYTSLIKVWFKSMSDDNNLFEDVASRSFKVSAKMKLCNINIKNLIILSVSGIFKGFKNWQKVAEICYQLVHDRASRGLALFLIWRHKLIYMALTLCEHACKTVFDVKPGIDPCPSLAWPWDKAYQISSCTFAQKKFRCCKKKKVICFWNSFNFAFLQK